MTRYHKDIGLWLFGTIAVACVVASAPATALQVARYHDSRTWPGLLAVVALVLLLEVGTIASKLARLAVPQAGILLELFCILGLAVNAASNYAQAVLVAASSSAGIWLYLGAVAYGAFPPVLAYAMLRLFVRRAQTLRGDAQDAQRQAQYALAPIAHVAMVHAELRRLLPDLSIHVPLLPDAVQYERPQELPVPMPVDAEAVPVACLPDAQAHANYACPVCGASLSLGQYGAARRYGRCPACRQSP